jgi:hypothetical protein
VAEKDNLFFENKRIFVRQVFDKDLSCKELVKKKFALIDIRLKSRKFGHPTFFGLVQQLLGSRPSFASPTLSVRVNILFNTLQMHPNGKKTLFFRGFLNGGCFQRTNNSYVLCIYVNFIQQHCYLFP